MGSLFRGRRSGSAPPGGADLHLSDEAEGNARVFSDFHGRLAYVCWTGSILHFRRLEEA